jgi:hypothetical protein
MLLVQHVSRDAGKPKAPFTNLVAEPGVGTGVVTDAVNDMLKAISGSLLVEQGRRPPSRRYPAITVHGSG